MTKVRKNKSKASIDVNIKEAFEIIDRFLPRNYVKLTAPYLKGVTENNIRQVKHRRCGDIDVIIALRKVAEQTKDKFNQ